jgi:hypothetical protein
MRFDPSYRTTKPTVKRPVDGISRKQTVSKATAASGSIAITQPVVRPQHQRAQFAPPQPKRGLWQKMQLPLIVFAGTLAGFLIQTSAFGMMIIALYGVYAVITGVPSRTTFILAALSVGTVACLLLIKPDPELVTNFSTYTFLLLVIGVIALLREGRPLKRRKRSRTRGRRL